MNNKNKKVREKKKPENAGKVECVMEEFLMNINDLPPEKKFDALYEKHCESLKAAQSLIDNVKTLESKLSNCDKEKEKLASDTTKRFLAQSRLEGVCRELQRQNKLLKDENLQKIREEEEKRRDVSNKFQAALNEVTAIMHENSEKNLKLRDDNFEMSVKFQHICDQFKEKEEDFSRLKKQLKLEKQLADAMVKKVQCELAAEREIWNREKEHIETQLRISEDERVKLELNLQALQNSLSTYNDKYVEFESTISRSNKIFTDYKTEMGKMSKQVSRLEDDCLSWKRKWESAANMIINLKNEKHLSENDKQQLERKLNQLSNLCRTLQEDRLQYLNQLRVHGIDPDSATQKNPTIPTSTIETSQVPDLTSNLNILTLDSDVPQGNPDSSSASNCVQSVSDTPVISNPTKSEMPNDDKTKSRASRKKKEKNK